MNNQQATLNPPSLINKEDFKHNVLVVSINKSVDSCTLPLTPIKLYKCTRKSWLLKPDKARQSDYVIAKYKGILKEIYQPSIWYHYSTENKKKRYAFEGDVVSDPEIRKLYLNKKMNNKSRSAVIYVKQGM